METSTFLETWASSGDGRMVYDLIRSSHTAEKREAQMVRRNRNIIPEEMIEFEESLRWFG